MNVLQVSKFYYPKIGGIEHVAHELSKACVSRGDSVTAVSAVERGLGEHSEYDGVNCFKASSLGVRLSIPIAPTFPVHLERAKRNADLMHFHLPDPLSVSSELLTGRTDTATVATIHGEIAKESYKRVLPLYRPVLDRFMDRVDSIVISSPRHREKSSLLSSNRDKCTVIPLGIDHDKFGSYSGPEYELPGNPNRLTVLFVGRLVYFKGIRYAIDAMKDVEADLLIAGTGELAGELRRRADRQGVKDRVHFLGYVPDEKLHYCYDIADVFVLPSTTNTETFGIVQVEAMAYGTPVVNTNLDTSVPWVSQDGVTGITVPPKDATAIADALNVLLRDPDLREKVGHAARRRAETNFTTERMINQYLDLYDALVESP
jgi:rhamnosyl/mannosyltransferase